LLLLLLLLMVMSFPEQSASYELFKKFSVGIRKDITIIRRAPADGDELS
jgi:hypothetical protein